MTLLTGCGPSVLRLPSQMHSPDEQVDELVALGITAEWQPCTSLACARSWRHVALTPPTEVTRRDDQLVGATTDIAEAVELHQTTTTDGSMSMQQLDGVEIPAGGETVLEPGALHLMLIGVTDELAEGDTVEFTLTFDNAGEQTVTAEVVPLGDVPGMDMSSER